MPIHTRSATKKLVEVGGGLYAFVSLSETGEGIHTRFEYDDSYASSTSDSDSSGSFSSDYSANSTPASSLPSFTSESSHPSTNHRCNSSSTFRVARPLQRRSERWVRDPESGELYLMPENNSWPSVQTASNSSRSSEQANEDRIFEREYRKIMENHNYIADKTRRLIALEELDEDMTHDTRQMFNNNNASKPPVEEPPRVALVSTPGNRLGPHGTELIDHETFRPLPGDSSVYPQRWATHQSTTLRCQPTESNVL